MRIRTLTLATAGLLTLSASLSAQLPQAKLRSIYPPSGQPGATFEFKLTSGDDLEEITALHFTHPGITGKLRMQEVNGKPEPVENTFDVTIAGDVPAGVYEVRASGLYGVTDPRRFAVAPRGHVADAEPNNTPAQAQAVERNVSITGRIEGGNDVDCFKFTAEQGQRIVIDCLADRLDSRMTAALTLRDAAGKRLASAIAAAGDDPTLIFDVPATGEYVVELHDQTYRSGAEFVYRLDLHTSPHVALVMPPAGPAGSRTRFAFYGYNLPGGARIEQSLHGAPLERVEVDVDVPGPDAMAAIQNLVRSHEVDVDAFSWIWQSPQGPANPVRIGISDRPATLEAGSNSEPSQAQVIAAPAEVAGQLLKPGETDWYAFPARPGEVYWIEVIGQRCGSPIDPVIIVEEVTKNAEGQEQVRRLAVQDDDGTNVAPNVFDTFTDDPVYRLAVDKEATYRVGVYDRYGQTRGGPDLRYRLSIRPEEPDFRVVALPAQAANNAGVPTPVGLRKGDTVGVNVYALRKYGYEGPIEVTVEGLPAGVHCPGTTIGSRENGSQLVFRTAEDAAEGVASVRIVSHAVIESPAAQRSLEGADKAIADAEKPLPDLRKKLDDARAKLAQAVQQRDDAARRLQTDAASAGLKQELEQKQQALAQAQQELTQAAEALAAGEKTLIDARTRREAALAQQQAARRHVRHLVRSGTLMIPGSNNVPSKGRLSQDFTIAVLRETAPFEVRTEAERVAVSQSRQILVPVQLVKRGGFNERVALNVAGVPRNSNLQAPNIAVDKGQESAVLSIFVKDNTPPGTYTLWLNSQGQVSYSRNPEKTERLRAERDALAAKLKEAQDAQAKATELKNTAVQQATAAATALQQAQQRKQQADQLVTQKTKERDDLKPVKEAADRKVEELSKGVAAAEQALKEAQEALAADAENEDLKTKLAAAEQSLAEAKKLVETATAEREEAAKKLTAAEQALTESTTAAAQADAAVKQAETDKGTADKSKTEAEAAEQAAIAATKQVDDLKKVADKRFDDADKVSKPQNKNYTPPSLPIVFDVSPAPLKLTANVPGGGALKVGAGLEITVKVERQNGYSGPVALSLPLPPGVQGLTGAAEIPADQSEAKLIVAAAADATTGQLPHMVVRAAALWHGQEHLVDVPVTIKVDK